MNNSGALSENRGKPANPKGVKPPQRPAPHRGKPVAQRRKNIQSIDLSHSGDQNGYTQHGPREYRKLQRLNTNVNKGASAPIIRAETPNFSYAAGSQPQISFLNHPVSTSVPTGKPSSGCDDGWMDDFPSPSILLDKEKSNNAYALGCIFSSPAAEQAASNSNSASTHAGYEDDHNSAITLSDRKRKAIDLESGPCAIDQRETSTPPLPELPRVASVQREGLQYIESDDRLFCSVDSPNQTTSPMEKRKVAAGPELLRLKETPTIERRPRTVSPQIFGTTSENDFPRAKKRRVSDASIDQVVLLSINMAGRSQPKPSGESLKGSHSQLVEESDFDLVKGEGGFMGFM